MLKNPTIDFPNCYFGYFFPFQFVIGSAGTELPDVPKPTRKFVIGAAANGDEIRRPLSSRKSTVGAAAVER